jgi:hypothetical protein
MTGICLVYCISDIRHMSSHVRYIPVIYLHFNISTGFRCVPAAVSQGSGRSAISPSPRSHRERIHRPAPRGRRSRSEPPRESRRDCGETCGRLRLAASQRCHAAASPRHQQIEVQLYVIMHFIIDYTSYVKTQDNAAL